MRSSRIAIALRSRSCSSPDSSQTRSLKPSSCQHCILKLLAAGHNVRTTIRSLTREADVRTALSEARMASGFWCRERGVVTCLVDPRIWWRDGRAGHFQVGEFGLLPAWCGSSQTSGSRALPDRAG